MIQNKLFKMKKFAEKLATDLQVQKNIKCAKTTVVKMLKITKIFQQWS